MNVAVTGGSGFIGSALVQVLKARGHTPVVLDMRPPQGGADYYRADLGQPLDPSALSDVDAVINLAGASIFKRWNAKVKQTIYDSRIVVTRNVVAAMKQARVSTLISASATGFFGNKGEELLTEASEPGNDFLSRVCKDWEHEANKAAGRVVCIRTSPVVGGGGLLQALLPIYNFGLGGRLGSGQQWFPWIHIQDIVGIYLFALEHDAMHGSVNAAAPERVRQEEFARTLGGVLHRPAVIPAPAWALKLAVNDLADAVLASQKVSSEKVRHAGYSFAFPALREALHEAVENSN